MNFLVGIALLVFCCVQMTSATFPHRRGHCAIPNLPNGYHNKGKARYVSVGSRVLFSCNDGYERRGYDVIGCVFPGRFFYPIPRCEARCDRPADPRNGRVVSHPEDKSRFRPEEEVEFTCNEGFRLDGEDEIECGSDGNWEDDFPTCEPRCRRPREPRFGSVRSKPSGRDFFDEGGRVWISCSNGYRLSSNGDLTCQRSGRWNKPVPRCDPIPRCSRPDDPDNGSVRSRPPRVNHFDEGGKVWFSCDNGFRLSGPGDLTCQENGKWNRAFPDCQPIPRCSRPDDPDNGSVRSRPPRVNHFDEGGKVWFSCDNGFRLSGPGDLTCQENGKWNRAFPICQRQCSRPEEPENGSLRSNPRRAELFNKGGRVWFSCDEGFSLSSNGDLTCQANGQWNREVPTCTSNPCRRPEDPENGSLRSNPRGARTFQPGGRVWFSCDEGFELSSAGDLVCEEGGEWNDDFPECVRKQIIQCKIPNPPRYGSVTSKVRRAKYVSVGKKIWFSCNNGFKLGGSGRKDITCTESGWEFNFPICVGSCSIGCNIPRRRRGRGHPCRCDRWCQYRYTKSNCCSDYDQFCPENGY